MYTSVRCIHVIVSGFAIRKKKTVGGFFYGNCFYHSNYWNWNLGL